MILTQEAICYTIGCIADIAFPQKECKVIYSDVPMLLVGSDITIKFKQLDSSNIDILFSGNALYSKVKSFDNKVIVKEFSLTENKDLFSYENGVVHVNFDMISVSFLLLSRYEETLTDNCDKYGRFCYSDSLCSKYDFVDVPLVDECAMLLRKFVVDNIPNFPIEKRNSRFIPTHDIDFLFRFPNFPKAIKTIAGDLFKRKSLRMSCKSLSSYMKSLRDFKYDPYTFAMLELAKVSVELNLCSSFYFKALRNKDSDCTYNALSPKSMACIRHLQSLGVKVGLHGSFNSFSDKSLFDREKRNLESVCGCGISDVRQHFLRFDVSKTPQIWQSLGIRHDSTLGFPEHEGFRCGTCHPYPLFDIERNCVTDVIEHPLIVMDTTLFQYRNLTEDDAFASICRLYERCVAVEGDFVLLWHNTTMFGELDSWYRNVYLRFVNFLVE